MIPFVLLQDSRRSQIRHRMSHSILLSRVAAWQPESAVQVQASAVLGPVAIARPGISPG